MFISPISSPDGVVDDAVHDRVRVHAAAEPRVPVLLSDCVHRTVDASVAQLEKLQQHSPEQLVRPLQEPLVYHEQAERPVLPQQLPLAAGPVAALAPEVLEVGLPYVAGPDPLGAGRLGERAREVGLAGPGRPEEHDVVAALGDPQVASSATVTLSSPRPSEKSIDLTSASGYLSDARFVRFLTFWLMKDEWASSTAAWSLSRTSSPCRGSRPGP